MNTTTATPDRTASKALLLERLKASPDVLVQLAAVNVLDDKPLWSDDSTPVDTPALPAGCEWAVRPPWHNAPATPALGMTIDAPIVKSAPRVRSFGRTAGRSQRRSASRRSAAQTSSDDGGGSAPPPSDPDQSTGLTFHSHLLCGSHGVSRFLLHEVMA